MHSNKNQIKNNRIYQADYVLFLLVSALIITSIIFSYSLSVYTVQYFEYNQFHFFIRQLFVGVLSIFIMWGFSLLNPDKIVNKLGMFLFITFFILMAIMPFLPASLVTASGGANRWIRLPGFSLSPVEFFKIGFIYFLSWSFHRRLIEIPKKITLKEEFILLLPYFFSFIIIVFIIAFLQKDLGQVVLLGGILFILLIFANRSYKVFVTLGLVGVIALVGLIVAAPHRIQRIFSWWAMVQDGILMVLPSWADKYLRIEDLPEPYQVSHSLNAMNNGGMFGQGLGLGDIKLGFLSEVHTDFVLAGITEEIGFVGLVLISVLMFLIVLRIFKISGRVENKIYHLFTIGVALMIIIAFLINSYGISGMIPIKGIAVPLVSYGGSSMLSMAIAIGLVLSISKSVDLRKKVK
ncbi:FtsW/RodA/SpoVE family cell cycle protein [Halarcobacter bivalviorum]|uniref:Probable peptidoglycan glycosyltransferase FtsW n=1 Tax=Halarcobacter bivalviorum TaxID=663364 RepID=A0AAX2A5E3_9BACT|nr:FtsW/RodA/SpoVE family cell cycle protein [Halarcobacter bivalviorum]AXH11379.1 cell division protein, FtsW/RodA/SpoVE family [Halarcobacter bivalviorum]RXK09432.1 cell division protein [Halarcobacter bivalviorum]